MNSSTERELVKRLVDEIGLDTLYAIVCDMRGENTPKIIADYNNMKRENEELREHIRYINIDKARMEGEIKGLQFSIRCNGVSGNEVRS